MRQNRFFLGSLIMALLFCSGCRDGRIPCPDLEVKNVSFFRKKLYPGNSKEALSEQNVSFTKNGLIKKKNYKYLRNKPKQKKYR